MLRILKKTATSSAARTVGSVPSADGDDLSTWELVNASQSDEDVFSFDVISDTDSVTASEKSDEEEIAVDSREIDHAISFQSLSVSPPMKVHVGVGDDVGACGGDDDDDSDDGEYDVDDELVPWTVKDRMGKQRIRKMGKRGGGPNWNKSKRMPFYCNRPGCVYGKHGFGVQHSFI